MPVFCIARVHRGEKREKKGGKGSESRSLSNLEFQKKSSQSKIRQTPEEFSGGEKKKDSNDANDPFRKQRKGGEELDRRKNTVAWKEEGKKSRGPSNPYFVR